MCDTTHFFHRSKYLGMWRESLDETGPFCRHLRCSIAPSSRGGRIAQKIRHKRFAKCNLQAAFIKLAPSPVSPPHGWLARKRHFIGQLWARVGFRKESAKQHDDCLSQYFKGVNKRRPPGSKPLHLHHSGQLRFYGRLCVCNHNSIVFSSTFLPPDQTR